MTFQEFKEAVIARCTQVGLKEYELYYMSGTATNIDTFQHNINEFSSSESGGVCLRGIVNGKMGYASTEELSMSSAQALVDRVLDNASVLEAEEQVFLCEGGQDYAPLDREIRQLPSTEEMIRKALEVEQKIYDADEAIIDGSQAGVIREHAEIAIYNSKGLDLSYVNNATGLVVVAVAGNGQEMSNDYQIKLGQLDQLDVDGMIGKAVESAKRKLGGEPAPTGQYPVIFSTDAMCSLLQVFSSVFSSETAQKGLSRLGDQEGSVIASQLVTLVDDPFHPDSPMRINFDAEGCPTCKKNVIENGKLCTLLYNMKTAAAVGKKTTGNGSKADYNAPVGIRPFTMYLENGQLTPEELLQKAGEGVYITDLGGLHAGANPISGDFSLQSAGFMIHEGKKCEYVKSFTVAGNFYDVLKNITALANNCHLPAAFGTTAFGSPDVLVEGLSVAGK